MIETTTPSHAAPVRAHHGALKIALVSPYDFGTPGGVNNHVNNLARELRAKGHSVTVIGPLANSRERSLEPGFIPMGRPVPRP